VGRDSFHTGKVGTCTVAAWIRWIRDVSKTYFKRYNLDTIPILYTLVNYLFDI